MAGGDPVSGVVYRPQGPHSCDLPGGIETIGEDYRKGVVWQCDCGTTWVSQGITGGGLQRSGGYASGGLEWKRESKRARRKRERNAEFVLPAGGGQVRIAGRRLDPNSTADASLHRAITTPAPVTPRADGAYFAVERDADGIPTALRPLDSAGIRRTRDGWAYSTEEQGTTKQGETD